MPKNSKRKDQNPEQRRNAPIHISATFDEAVEALANWKPKPVRRKPRRAGGEKLVCGGFLPGWGGFEPVGWVCRVCNSDFFGSSEPTRQERQFRLLARFVAERSKGPPRA